MPVAPSVLEVRGLRTCFRVPGGEVAALEEVDLDVPAGGTLALVGESGSGKSVAALSILGLLPRGAGRVAGGRATFIAPGEPAIDLVRLGPERLREVRGAKIGIVFQEPMTSLNPVFTIAEQVGEPLRVHTGLSRAAVRAEVLSLLTQVGLPDPARRMGQYPHELSGGQRQRVTIAMALACNPALLIADEPTTALDVTIQAQILDLLRRLQQSRGMAMLFITHNLGVVAEIADTIAVMYAGRVVEAGTVAEVFRAPRHPYTRGLLAAMPRIGRAGAMRRAGLELPSIPGIVPALAERPPGCSFAPRCALAAPECRAGVPGLELVGAGHAARCWRWREVAP